MVIRCDSLVKVGMWTDIAFFFDEAGGSIGNVFGGVVHNVSLISTWARVLQIQSCLTSIRELGPSFSTTMV